MAAPNEVKFKVRHYALLLEEFTVSQIVELTGLKSPSVRTEVQRMKREGLVTASRQKARGRGGPPCVYRLTDDPEARLALSRSVEAFYTETAPRPVEPRRPASRHFFQAVQLIQDLISQDVAESQRDAAIEEATYHLECTRREEGVGREGTEVVGAFLNRERAKLAAVQGNIAEAARLFRQAIDALQAAALYDEAERVYSDWLCILLRQQIETARTSETLGLLHTVELLKQRFDSVDERDLKKYPLARVLRDLCDLLVEKGRKEQPTYLVLDHLRVEIEQTAYQSQKTTDIVEEQTRKIQKMFEMLTSTAMILAKLEVPTPSVPEYPEAPARDWRIEKRFDRDWSRLPMLGKELKHD